ARSGTWGGQGRSVRVEVSAGDLSLWRKDLSFLSLLHRGRSQASGQRTERLAKRAHESPTKGFFPWGRRPCSVECIALARRARVASFAWHASLGQQHRLVGSRMG